MSLNKIIYAYSIGTDALYNKEEKYIHKRLLKLYSLRRKIKERNNSDEKWKHSSVNRVIKKEKEKLTSFLDMSLEKKDMRELTEEELSDKNIVGLFDSFLTRSLGLKPNTVTKEIIIVNVFFFQVFKSMVRDGFIFNKEKYIFLTSSAGQIRQKKAVFIKESSYKKIQLKMMCGLTLDRINELGGMNRNKFCAYLALNESATEVWENFDVRRAIVVEDFETCFQSEVDYIDYNTYKIERKQMPVKIPCTDGWGIVDGETTRQVRLPWIKGLLTNFPLQQYLKEKCSPQEWIVKDIWGQEHNVVEENIKYIFCKSQMKLHKFYSSWNDYCKNFEKFECTANYCNIEEQSINNARINYQMLQQLVEVTDKEIEKLVRNTITEIEAIGNDYQTTMRLLGATEYNKNPSWFQEALMIYPELFRDPYCRDILKQTKKSLVKQAKGGRIRVNGKYLFVAPNPLTFCEHLFKRIEFPSDILSNNEVYTNQFPNGAELALLRSPSLGKEWGIKINKRNEELDKWLGNTNCIYTSSYDTISKLLSFDCDGDKLLVLQDKNLIKLGKRLMKGVVPLYYEMKKAEASKLTPETIYEGISLAFTSGNIGPASNLITIVKNNNESDREEADKVVKWLTMEVNFLIDGAKTLFFLTRPKYADEIIKKHTKGKLPNFFIYAKDKESHQVELPNNSTMNRIAASIPDPTVRFSKSISKFDYRMLMNLDCDFSVSPESPVVKSYDYWNIRQDLFNGEDLNQKDQDLYKYKQIRKKIIEESQKDLDYIVNTLVAVLYTSRRASAKKTLWVCFGDVILENLKRNLEGKGKICQICGKRFMPKNSLQNCCSRDCYQESNNRAGKERYFCRTNH